MARYDCDIPGFDDAFVEMSDRWTRGELRRFWEAKGAEYLTMVGDKITSLYLPTATGEAIDDPEKLTEDNLDDIDIILWQWFSNVPIAHIGTLNSLGETAGRRLFNISDLKNSETTDAQEFPQN